MEVTGVDKGWSQGDTRVDKVMVATCAFLLTWRVTHPKARCAREGIGQRR